MQDIIQQERLLVGHRLLDESTENRNVVKELKAILEKRRSYSL